MIAVQIYIKKNTLVITGKVTDKSTTPFLTVKNTTASYTTNQYKGHYIKIISGTGLGSISWIASNTSTILTLQTAIFTDTTTEYEIYRADYQKLDLFNDEKISITSSVANANDIGKIFTDYSQSFTIPASDRNNKILSHWYESSIDNGYDHRQRYDGYIEINTQRFKDGNFQLEKASKKNGFVESYSVTFYGNLTQLKDKFKDTKLKDLIDANGFNWWSTLNHTYSAAEVKNRITATTLQNVYYPLIGSYRKYFYKNTISGQDITLSSGAIKWNDLFPAVSLPSIFYLIQQCFGVTFTGSFFNLDQWKKLYLYLKNTELIKAQTKISDLVFTSSDFTTKFPAIFGPPMAEFNLSTGVLKLNRPVGASRVQITITTSSTNYTLYVYRNGLLFNTLKLTGSGTFEIDYFGSTINQNIQYTYNFKISSELPISFTTTLYYSITQYTYVSLNVSSASTTTAYATGSTTTIGEIEVGNFVPDITVNDFITGIVKAFNLMIIPKDLNTFEFIPLELYYNQGKVLDITKYVYSDETEVERPKLYKSVNFQYEKSTNILNNAFKGLYNTEYGDLIYTNNNSNESSNYDIKLPFENVLFEKTIGENFETATLWDKDLKPYTPKPMLIYKNGIESLSTPVIMTTETGTTTFSTYNRFSNEYNSFPTDLSYRGLMTMNFSNEQSPWYNVLAPQGLYYRHYKNYIDNLYNIKTRVIKVKALFPSSLMGSNVMTGNNQKTGIALNDRLIIRNKRYIINNMTTDLTTGETNLELITDYRGINAASSVGYRFASIDVLDTNKEALSFDLVIYLNDYDSFGVKGAINFLSYPTTGLQEYGDLVLPVTIPYNSSGLDRYDQIGIEYYKDGTLQITENISISQTAI
jgi:hypothetical protein